MASFLERQSERLASHSSRRSFLRLAAKITSAVAGVGFGFTRIYKEAAAANYACCTLAFYPNFCPTCPSCPRGETNPYTWYCCYGRCLYACTECCDHSCSCGTVLPENGACGSCPHTPAP